VFFMLYILFSAFIGGSWMLLRPWGLLMTSLRLAGARTPACRAGRHLQVGTEPDPGGGTLELHPRPPKSVRRVCQGSWSHTGRDVRTYHSLHLA
jgi:hypothetical protein